MPRPKRIRRIANPPGFRGFVPIGDAGKHEPVIMNLEEYESIRLCDHELLSQLEAAKRMGVSRPTFTRIYENARRKVAQAFARQLPILFEGGKIYFDTHWYHCHNCGCWFNDPWNESGVTNCALCGSADIFPVGKDIPG